MSSDVYIDISGWGPDVRPLRVGHLATLSYYEPNFKAWLEFYSRAFPVFNDTAELVLPNALAQFKSELNNLREHSSGWRRAMWGCDNVPWDDIVHPGDLSSFIAENKGRTWSVRVD
jgi:hypothetical protein